MVTFFMSRADAGQPQAHQAQLWQYKNWLSAIHVQVAEWLPASSASPSDPLLIEAAELLKLISSYMHKAWAAYQADMQQHGKPTAQSMRQLHDAALLCMLFGWLPPVRASMLISLHKPDLPHKCMSVNCSCPGNHLTWIKRYGVLSGRWHHHKTARKIQKQPIAFVLPSDLTTLLKPLLEPQNRWLLEKKGQGCRTVFVTRSGEELNQDRWQSYFVHLMGQLGQFCSVLYCCLYCYLYC